MTLAVAALAAYAIGAIPVGFLIARAFGIGDIRRHGSGNIGMTNVLRTAGKLPAILTLVGDVGKGALAVAVGGAIAGGDTRGAAVAAVAAVIGNCWSVFLGFRGGKGGATGLGAMLLLVPLAMLPAVIVFLVVTLTTRYVSLGTLLATIGVPLAALAIGYPSVSVAATAGAAAIVVLRHRENIDRLRHGTERRVGERVARS